MSQQIDIERALYTQFATLGYTYVSYPNGPVITPSSTDMNYAVDTIYGDGVPASLGGQVPERFRGIFQVTIRCPVVTAAGSAAGTYEGLVKAQAIADTFYHGLMLQYPAAPASADTYVHCGTPTIRHLGKVTPEWYSIVVRIPFWADV